MDTELNIVYDSGKYMLTFKPSMTIITTEDELQLQQLFSVFVDSHEIQKEIDNVL